MSLYLVIFILSVIIIALLVWQWRHQRMLSLRVRLIREALRNKDFMFRLPTKRMLPGDRNLHVALNEMFGEINRLLARNEVESWQRLTRVLTHEIMNAMTPISSITQVYIDSSLVKGTPLEEGMRAIYDTSLSLGTFVDSYRKLTQLQSPHIEEVALIDVLSTVRMLYPQVEWHVDLENKQMRVLADSGLMRQVLVNIVKNAVEAEFDSADCIIMAAAVADYRVKERASQKMKKTADDEITLTLVKNPDILKEVETLVREKLAAPNQPVEEAVEV